jgi:hypothetical protein
VSRRGDWLDRHTSRAPAALRARVLEHAATVPADAPLPLALAEAGRAALERVTAHPGDRSVALDLLAADALITLALLAQAQADPARLGDFAAAELKAGRPGA